MSPLNGSTIARGMPTPTHPPDEDEVFDGYMVVRKLLDARERAHEAKEQIAESKKALKDADTEIRALEAELVASFRVSSFEAVTFDRGYKKYAIIPRGDEISVLLVGDTFGLKPPIHQSFTPPEAGHASTDVPDDSELFEALAEPALAHAR